MKKLSYALLISSTCCILYAQSTAPTAEISDLKKQVSSINNSNIKVSRSLYALKKKTKVVEDSLKVAVTELEKKFKIVNDSLLSDELKISAMKADTDKNTNDIKRMHTLVIILFIISMIIIALTSFLLNNKIKNTCGKIKSDLQKVIESAATDINNLSIKLTELEKKVSK
jgi:hypothetical protein